MANLYFDTPPLTIIDYPADAAHTGPLRVATEIEYFILHATVGGKQSSLDYLTKTSSGANKVSVQCLIDKAGNNYKLMPPLNTAYHAGFGVIGPIGPYKDVNLNARSVGIEFVNKNDGKDPWPLVQVRAGAWQVVEWIGKFGHQPILGHYQVDVNKTDPAGFPWAVFYREMNSRIQSILQPIALPLDFAPHLRVASGAAQTVVAELTAMLASLE